MTASQDRGRNRFSHKGHSRSVDALGLSRSQIRSNLLFQQQLLLLLLLYTFAIPPTTSLLLSIYRCRELKVCFGLPGVSRPALRRPCSSSTSINLLSCFALCVCIALRIASCLRVVADRIGVGCRWSRWAWPTSFNPRRSVVTRLERHETHQVWSSIAGRFGRYVA